MDCTIIVSVLALVVAVISINIPIITTPRKTGWKNNNKYVGLSLGDIFNPAPHPTTDSSYSDKSYHSKENEYGISIKNFLFAKAEIYLTTVTLYGKTTIQKEYRGRWWDRTADKLYRITPVEDEQQITLGARQEKDLVLFYKQDEDYYIFSSNTDRKTIHPHHDEKITVPCYGVVSISGHWLRKNIYFRAEEVYGDLEIKIIPRWAFTKS